MKILPHILPIVSLVRSQAQNAGIDSLQSTCLPTAPLNTLRANHSRRIKRQSKMPCRSTSRRNCSSGGSSPREHYASSVSPPTNAKHWTGLASSRVTTSMLTWGLCRSVRQRPNDGVYHPRPSWSHARISDRLADSGDDYRIETKTYGPGQEALQHAISRYNTGDTQRGIANGYLGRVLAAVRRSPAETPGGKR